MNSDSDKLVTPAAKAVEAGCPICLESFKDKAFVDVCFHILLMLPIVWTMTNECGLLWLPL